MKVVLLLGGLAVAGVWARRGRGPKDAAAQQGGLSIYALIKRRLARDPDKPLSDKGFPRIPLKEESDFAFAPGAADALLGGFDRDGAKDARKIRRIVKAANQGKLADWRALEAELGAVTAINAVDALLAMLRAADLTPRLHDWLWEIIRGSRNYEAIKWAMAIGGVTMTDAEAADCLRLARFPEFTRYAAVALLRAAEERPELKRQFVGLLPASRQWGVVNVIEYIVRDAELIRDPDVQRAVLIHGMENHDGIEMEVAFTIAQAVDLPAFFVQAIGDARLRRALCELVHALIRQPEPLGGLRDMENWRTVLDGFLAMLEATPPDLDALVGLDDVEAFASATSSPAKDDEALRRRTAAAGRRIDVARAIIDGLRDPASRWRALEMVKKRPWPGAFDEVARLLRANPGDHGLIDVLCRSPNPAHLQFLLDSIGGLVDLDDRRGRPLSRVNLHGKGVAQHYAYARIVASLGRLATPEAVAQIVEALADYDPQVRAAACSAAAELAPTSVSPARREAIERLVRERLTDSPDWIVHAALSCAAAWGWRLTAKEKRQILKSCRRMTDKAKQDLARL